MHNCFPLHSDSLQRQGISSSVGTVEGCPVLFSRAATATVGRSSMAHGETPVKSWKWLCFMSMVKLSKSHESSSTIL